LGLKKNRRNALSYAAPSSVQQVAPGGATNQRSQS
jgi:hypothetical protein